MSIRRRLTLSFATILGLFALNLVLFKWSNAQRADAVRSLESAVKRQVIVTEMHRQIEDRRREIELFSRLESNAALGPAALEDLRRQMNSISNQLRELKLLARGESLALAEQFGAFFNDLRESWTIFGVSFGGENHATAITELVLRGEPLSDRSLEALSALRTHEGKEVIRASQTFKEVTDLTDSLTLSIFLASVGLAGLVAMRISRHVGLGLSRLNEGVSAIGQGDLSNRIEIQSSDELGLLAGSFNQMAENLDTARNELAGAADRLEQHNRAIEEERSRAEQLLTNILPHEVAEELRAKGHVDPKYFEDVSILFTDFVGFSLASEKMAAEELVEFLNKQFTAFDQITERYGLEKLKTIGDSYMCAGGLPVRNPSHPVDIVLAAFEMVHAVESAFPPGAEKPWSIRVGIHTGPVIAGVVGIQKFAFDVWGETVNQSSRMESGSEPGQINISESTYARVKDFFACRKRGKLLTKEKRKVAMYFADDLLPKLMDDHQVSPPPAFVRRYRIYFQEDPPDFPSFLIDRSHDTRQAS